MLRCVANDMNRWEIFPSLLIDQYIQYIHIRIIIGKILTTQRSMGENAFHMVFQDRWSFLPLVTKILRSPLRGCGQDTVSSWQKTPSLLENHVKCISSNNNIFDMDMICIYVIYLQYITYCLRLVMD